MCEVEHKEELSIGVHLLVVDGHFLIGVDQHDALLLPLYHWLGGFFLLLEVDQLTVGRIHCVHLQLFGYYFCVLRFLDGED